MEKEDFIKKLNKIDGFLSVKPNEVDSVVEVGLSVMKDEFARLLEEKFPYSSNSSCLRIVYIKINGEDSVYELIYAADMVKNNHVSLAKTPLTYMVGFTDKMLVAAASDVNIVEPIVMFENFIKSYHKQSDEEFLDMPLSDIAYLIKHGNAEKSNINGVKGEIEINMIDYDKDYTSEEILRKIKDCQGSCLLTASNIDMDTVLHANAFMDNIINRSAKLTSKSIAEIGMMKEQALSYGLNASSSKIMELQIQDSPLSGLAGMF